MGISDVLKDRAKSMTSSFPFTNLGSDNSSNSKRGHLVKTPYEENGQMYVNVRLIAERGKITIVNRVKLKEQNRGIIAPLSEGDPVTVTFPTPEALAKKEADSAVASRSDDHTLKENQALPASFARKMDSNSLIRGDNNVCLGYKQAQQNLAKMRASLQQKDSLVSIRTPKGGKSSSGLALSNDGQLAIFDKSGQNKQEMTAQGITQKAREIDSADSKRSRSNAAYGGLPAQETMMADMVPKSNVFMPTPTHIPHVTRIVMMIGLARAIIGVGKIAKEGLEAVKRLKDQVKQSEDKEEAERREKINQLLDPSVPAGEKAELVQEVMGERTFNSDKERVNQLKKIERWKAMIPVLQNSGQISADDVLILEGMITHEQKELKQRGSTKTKRSQAFDQIASNAGRKAKEMIQRHHETGTLDPFSREKQLDARKFQPKKLTTSDITGANPRK